MAQHKKLTSGVIPQIKMWLNQGFTAEEIAEKIGCTLGTLRVRCSQLGISLRHSKARLSPSASFPIGRKVLSSPSEHVASRRGEPLLVLVHETTLRRLRRRAAMKGLPHSILAASLLEKIVEDDLFDAVLDDDAAIDAENPGDNLLNQE